MGFVDRRAVMPTGYGRLGTVFFKEIFLRRGETGIQWRTAFITPVHHGQGREASMSEDVQALERSH